MDISDVWHLPFWDATKTVFFFRLGDLAGTQPALTDHDWESYCGWFRNPAPDG